MRRIAQRQLLDLQIIPGSASTRRFRKVQLAIGRGGRRTYEGAAVNSGI